MSREYLFRVSTDMGQIADCFDECDCIDDVEPVNLLGIRTDTELLHECLDDVWVVVDNPRDERSILSNVRVHVCVFYAHVFSNMLI